MRQILLIFVFGLTAFAARAEVKVIDGDSLIVDGREIRLEGIDAPEYHQTCYDAQKRQYPCGEIAFHALQKLAGADTDCKTVIVDKYHRFVSVCYSGGEDINHKMVAEGQAVAYTRYTQAYASAEQEAKAAKRGIWQGRFLKPEFYRILEKERKKAK